MIPCGCLTAVQIADVTFSVWYRLSEELLKQDEAQLNELFKSYIQRLIVQLCVHCRMDEDTSPVSVVCCG